MNMRHDITIKLIEMELDKTNTRVTEVYGEANKLKLEENQLQVNIKQLTNTKLYLESMPNDPK